MFTNFHSDSIRSFDRRTRNSTVPPRSVQYGTIPFYILSPRSFVDTRSARHESDTDKMQNTKMYTDCSMSSCTVDIEDLFSISQLWKLELSFVFWHLIENMGNQRYDVSHWLKILLHLVYWTDLFSEIQTRERIFKFHIQKSWAISRYHAVYTWIINDSVVL